MKKLAFSDLRLRLALLVLLAVTPALALIFYAAEDQRRSSSLEAQESAQRLARLVSANQEVLIAGARQLLTAVAEVPVVRAGDAAGCSAFLQQVHGKYAYYTNLGVADVNGWLICSAVPLKDPVNIADRSYFRRTLERQDLALGDYQIGRVTGRATINVGYPWRDRRGDMAGVVFAGIDLTWLSRIAAQTRLPEGATVTLVDNDGVIFVRYPEPGTWIGRKMPEGDLLKAILHRNGEGTADAEGVDGIRRLYGFTRLSDNATVIVGLAKDSALASADRVKNSLQWLALAALVALGGAWWGGHWLIVRQVKNLIKASEQLGEGDLRARVQLPNSDADMRQLASSFNRMADGIEQRDGEARRAQQGLRRHLDETTALREINLAVTSTLDLDAVLKVLLEKIDELWPGAAALVWLQNRESGAWERKACCNLDEAAWKRREGTPPVVRAVIESRSPVAIADVDSDPRMVDPEFYLRQGFVSYLGVPLIMHDEVLGILSFLSRRERRFGAEEVVFFSVLAGEVAVAIYNSQLHAQAKQQSLELEQANDDLKRKEAIQALLKDLSQDFASQPLDNLLKKLTDKVREFFKVDIADVRVMDEGFRIMGISGIDEAQMRGGATGRGGGSRWVAEHRRPLVLPDINRVKEPPIGQTARRLGIQGYLAVPLFSRRGDVIGVLRALSYRPREFHAEEIDLLQQMSNGAGIALENARLLDQIRKQAAELSQASKVKNEFLGFVSHELRTPVNIIMGYAALMEGGMCGEPNPEQIKVLEKISVNSRELLSMIDQLLEATKIEAGAVKPEFIQVGATEFLEELKSIYSVPTQKAIGVEWKIPSDLPEIPTDPEKLRHILTNLLGNAVKYTNVGGVVLSARHLRDERVVEFTVADTGIGIPPEELPHIFDMFSQVRASRRHSSGGVGLGLHIVKKFTELLGGEIHVDSEQGVGSTFTLKIPCAHGKNGAANGTPAFL
ncbi:MAG TPA: GAF domain-containing protein [Candidatus Binatia bacterium]